MFWTFISLNQKFGYRIVLLNILEWFLLHLVANGVIMPWCTHVTNLRPFGQCLPWIWSWSITFALHAMNLLPWSSYLWRDMWIICCNSSFLIWMGSRCETKEVCQGFTFFLFFLNFYCSGQTLVNADLPISVKAAKSSNFPQQILEQYIT